MLKLGCEIEFFTPNITGEPPAAPGFAVHKEHYRGMWEINSFLAEATTVPKLVDQLMVHVSKVIDTLSTHDPLYAYAIPISSGLVFTGIHLHIQNTDYMPDLLADAVNKATEIGSVVMTNIARNRGLSLRQVISHHVWGFYRQSVHGWKSGNRYRPCLFNQTHQTYELRAIDFDQILPENRRKLTAVLKAAFDTITGAAPTINKKLISGLRGLPADINSMHDKVGYEHDEDGDRIIGDDGEYIHEERYGDRGRSLMHEATELLRDCNVKMLFAYHSLPGERDLRAGVVSTTETSCMGLDDTMLLSPIQYTFGLGSAPSRDTRYTLQRCVDVVGHLARRQELMAERLRIEAAEQASRTRQEEMERVSREPFLETPPAPFRPAIEQLESGTTVLARQMEPTLMWLEELQHLLAAHQHMETQAEFVEHLPTTIGIMLQEANAESRRLVTRLLCGTMTTEAWVDDFDLEEAVGNEYVSSGFDAYVRSVLCDQPPHVKRAFRIHMANMLIEALHGRAHAAVGRVIDRTQPVARVLSQPLTPTGSVEHRLQNIHREEAIAQLPWVIREIRNAKQLLMMLNSTYYKLRAGTVWLCLYEGNRYHLTTPTRRAVYNAGHKLCEHARVMETLQQALTTQATE